MFNINKKIALVTGAASGIGFELAKLFCLQGCKVAIGDIHGVEEAIQKLKNDGLDAIGLTMDVTDDNQVDAAIHKINADFGGLDILVNNAGLYTGIIRAPFEEISISEWERVFAVNVTGVFRVVKAASPLLRKSNTGRVINITSGTFFSAPPNMLHYVSTKGALTAMTRCLARELGQDNITVNAIAPGFTLSTGVVDEKLATNNDQLDRARSARAIKRDQYPQDLEGAICFLSSNEAGFITGQTLVVDGGSVMH